MIEAINVTSAARFREGCDRVLLDMTRLEAVPLCSAAGDES